MEKQLAYARPLEEVFADILAQHDRAIDAFVPSNGLEQKNAFLEGRIRNPRHEYPALSHMNIEAKQNALDGLAQEIDAHPSINPKFKSVYMGYIEGYRMRNAFMQAAIDIQQFQPGTKEREHSEAVYMERNIAIFGEPDVKTYRGLLHSMRQKVEAKELIGRAGIIKDELLALLPHGEPMEEATELSPEALKWLRQLIETLYGGMIAHVPEREEPFEPQEVADIFHTVIKEEFEESGEEWTVKVQSAASINVRVKDKTIIVPENRKPLDTLGVKKLVIHELGVHMLRSIMGEQTDLLPLKMGLPNNNTEEGLAKTLEIAYEKKPEDLAGIPYYLIAGMMHIDGMDFRDAFEVLWRRGAVTLTKERNDIDEKTIEQARDKAYKQMMRLARGTDTKPWFKDLTYFNGQQKIRRHIEEIKGDDLQATFMLLGKADPSNKEHERIMYETSTP